MRQHYIIIVVVIVVWEVKQIRLFLRLIRRENGTVSHFTMIKKYPVQGFATGDVVPVVLIELDRLLQPMHSCLVNSVHDSMVIDTHPDEIDDVLGIISLINTNLNDMIHATQILNEGEFDKSDWKDEDFHEEAMDNLFSDETIYTGPGGEEVDGEEIYDILLSEPGGLVYLMGWNEGHTSDVFSDWLEGSAVEGYGSSGYGNMDVDNDTDMMLMYVAGQPGMLKEIVNWAIYQRQQGSGSQYLAGENSIMELKEHLEQAGFIRPSYDQ